MLFFFYFSLQENWIEIWGRSSLCFVFPGVADLCRLLNSVVDPGPDHEWIRIDFGRLDDPADPLCQVAGGQKDTLKKKILKKTVIDPDLAWRFIFEKCWT